MHETITTILPMNRWHTRTHAAIASILDQKGVRVEILLITNGQDQTMHESAAQIAHQHSNIRLLHSTTENLPAALNLGLQACRTELVARMDADDWSHPDRFAIQSAYLRENPTIAGCGCGTSFLENNGNRKHIVIPPLTAPQARWKLLLSNVFVHGSMMLRCPSVLQVGGYNEEYRRAQDYDLWLKLANQGLGGVADILYTYFMPKSHTLDQTQADITSRILLNAWATLPSQEPPELKDLMARLLGDDTTARTELEAIMERDGPSRETIQAWMWSCRQHPIQQTDTNRRETRIRAARNMLIKASVNEVWLWGAGDFARMIVGSDLLGLPIAGIADDARAGEKIAGKTVRPPDQIPQGVAVLIASDLYENAIWDRSAPLRKRGIHIFRMPS